MRGIRSGREITYGKGRMLETFQTVHDHLFLCAGEVVLCSRGEYSGQSVIHRAHSVFKQRHLLKGEQRVNHPNEILRNSLKNGDFKYTNNEQSQNNNNNLACIECFHCIFKGPHHHICTYNVAEKLHQKKGGD